MVEAVIFDMDGLLIDSEPFWRRAHIEVLGNYGFVVTEDDVRAAAGKRTGDQVDIWQQRFRWKSPSNTKVTQEIVSHVAELIHLNGEALPGVHSLIKLFNNHEVPMAVASSSAPQLIEVVLEKLDIKKYMRFAHSAENEVNGKPAPDVFLSTAKRLGVKSTNCVVFEDSLNGVKAAKAAHMKCIAVPEHPHLPSKFQEAGADKIVKNLEEVEWSTVVSLWKKK